MIKARTILIGSDSVDTRLLEVVSPSVADLVEDTIFQSKEGVVFDSAGIPLPFSFQSLPRRDLEAEIKATVSDVFETRRQRAVHRTGDLYIPALVPGYYNYYHLLIDCISRVLLSAKVAAKKPRIVVTRFQSDRLHSFQGNLLEEVASVFGLQDGIEILEGELFYLDKAIVTRGSIKFVDPAMDIFQDIARRIANGRSRRRRTYISRSLASARRVINEDEVIATVSEFGFQVAHLEQMPLEEQIALFRDSDVILGPHGAGFANIIFSHPGTILIELLQENALYKMPIFAELAGLAGCEHVVVQEKGIRNEHFPGHAGNMHMEVDCADLRNVLSAYVNQGSLGLRMKLARKKKFTAKLGEAKRSRNTIQGSPVLDVHLMGNMANRMIQYMVARRIADAVNGCRISNVTLPEWGIHHPALPGGPDDENRVPIIRSDVDMEAMIDSLSSGEETRMNFKTYAQWFPNFPDLDFCRSLFPANEDEYPGFGPEYLVCNIRGGEILSANFLHYVLLPVEFYAELAQKMGLKMVFMGQIEDNTYCDALRQRFPDAIFHASRGPITDFQIFRNSKNLVCAVSTFSWMAAWLSHAERIILPINGMFNPMQCPAIDLLPYPDSRYCFYLFPKNYSVPLDQLEAAHKELEGKWQEVSLYEIPELRSSVYRHPVQVFDQFLAMFDEDYYLKTSKDVARLVETGRLASGRDHYITHGFSEGRRCFPFDADWYRSEYPDAQMEVEQGEYESLLHQFVLSGAARGYKSRATPILDVNLDGGFADRMIQYMVAQRICSEVKECIISNAILPEWGISHARLPGAPGEVLENARSNQQVDIMRAGRLLSVGSRPRLSFASRGRCLSNFPDLDFCRSLFPAQEQEYPGYGPEHLVCYVEFSDERDLHRVLLPADFYAELAESTGLQLVFLGQREDNVYWRALRERFPDADFMTSRGSKADFQIFRNSRYLVPGVGMSSWLAAWLSHAERIEFAVNGLFHPLQEPNVDLLPIWDKRYRFHLFPINYAVPVDRFAEAHAALAGGWRVIDREQLSTLRSPRRTRQMESFLLFFDEEFYLQTYPDIAAAVKSKGLKSGLDHFVARGFKEGRGAFGFDACWYSVAYPAAAREVGEGEYVDLPHQYVETGAARGYLPRPPRRSRQESTI